MQQRPVVSIFEYELLNPIRELGARRWDVIVWRGNEWWLAHKSGRRIITTRLPDNVVHTLNLYAHRLRPLTNYAPCLRDVAACHSAAATRPPLPPAEIVSRRLSLSLLQ